MAKRQNDHSTESRTAPLRARLADSSLPGRVRRLLRHRWLTRSLLLAAYGALLVALLGASSYLALSNFVRSGVIATPDLVGLDRQQAADSLAAVGLALRRVEDDRHDDEVPVGHILRQEPPAGSAVKAESGVAIFLSRGRELVETPDLTGQVLQTAEVSLTASGLSLGRSRSIYSENGTPGTVIIQDPPAGSLIDPSSPVDVMVSLANPSATFVMPELIDLPDAPVRAFFETNGFRLGRVRYEPYEGVPAGIILRQYPLPGHPLRQSDSIALVVAAGDSR